MKIFGGTADAMALMHLRQNKLADPSFVCCFGGYDAQREAYRFALRTMIQCLLPLNAALMKKSLHFLLGG